MKGRRPPSSWARARNGGGDAAGAAGTILNQTAREYYMSSHIGCRVLLAASLLVYSGLAAEPAPKLRPGSAVTITFPVMPPTFYDRQA